MAADKLHLLAVRQLDDLRLLLLLMELVNGLCLLNQMMRLMERERIGASSCEHGMLNELDRMSWLLLLLLLLVKLMLQLLQVLLLLVVVMQVDELLLLLLHLGNSLRLGLGLSDRGQLVLLNQMSMTLSGSDQARVVCIGVRELHWLTGIGTGGSQVGMVVVEVLRDQRRSRKVRASPRRHCSRSRCVAKGGRDGWKSAAGMLLSVVDIVRRFDAA